MSSNVSIGGIRPFVILDMIKKFYEEFTEMSIKIFSGVMPRGQATFLFYMLTFVLVVSLVLLLRSEFQGKRRKRRLRDRMVA